MDEETRALILALATLIKAINDPEWAEWNRETVRDADRRVFAFAKVGTYTTTPEMPPTMTDVSYSEVDQCVLVTTSDNAVHRVPIALSGDDYPKIGADYPFEDEMRDGNLWAVKRRAE
jgi:hypothetical protein